MVGTGGDTVRYGPGEVLVRLYRRYGPVVRWGFGPYRFAALLGPRANEFVFAHDATFRVREASAGLVPVDGPTSLVVSDGADHRRRRRLVQPALYHKRIDGYVAIMARCADEVIDAVRDGQAIDIHAAMQGALRRSTLQSLFGEHISVHADEFGAYLRPMLNLLDLLPQIVDGHRTLRTPRWRRAVTARSRVDARVYAEIARVREHGPDEQDHVLGELVHGRDHDGDGLNDLEVRDQVVTLIAAGYATTSAALTWAVYALATHTEVLRTARDEVDSVLGRRAPSAADLRALPYLSAVVQETLRLYPPAVVSGRHVAEEFEFDGTRVRAGTTLLISPYVTHRSADVFDDPLSFRPERWATGSGGDTPGPSEFLPFGGGRHRCVGSAMAVTEITVMLARLLARIDVRLPPRQIRATGFASMRPRDGLPVVVRHRSSREISSTTTDGPR